MSMCRSSAIFTALALFAWAVPGARAVVDDAHSFALEAATALVADGVELRHDYERGRLPSGGSVQVSYQLFRGNEYWFFGGASEDGVEITLALRDDEGKELPSEMTRGRNSATLRFTPDRTMMVHVVLTGSLERLAAFDWAVVYGFRAIQRGGQTDGN